MATTNKNQLTLAYWGVQGRNIALKPLLSYLKIDYKEKVYGAMENYFPNKANIDVPFVNLPYLIDGDFKVSETDAIIQYVIEKSGRSDLLGKNLQDRARVKQIESLLNELQEATYVVARAPKDQYQEKQEELKKKSYEPKLKQLDEFLQGKEWLLGYMTMVDFKLYQLAIHVNGQDPNILKSYKNVSAVHDRIANLESTKSYVKSNHCAPGVLPPFCNYLNIPDWSVMGEFAKVHQES